MINGISVYILLVLIFLGLSKSFSPEESKESYIQSSQIYAGEFIGRPISVVLVDTMETGFLIKTYHLKLKIVHLFKGPQVIIIRTSKELYDSLYPYLGMSIFRRNEKGIASTNIQPPGALFIGDHSYGHWKIEMLGGLDTQGKIWIFHRAYRHLPELLHWGTFKPTYRFYKKLNVINKLDKIFLGINNEFGRNGEATKNSLLTKMSRARNTDINFKDIFKRMIKLPRAKVNE